VTSWSNLLSLDFVYHQILYEVLRCGSRLCFRLQVEKTPNPVGLIERVTENRRLPERSTLLKIRWWKESKERSNPGYMLHKWCFVGHRSWIYKLFLDEIRASRSGGTGFESWQGHRLFWLMIRNFSQSARKSWHSTPKTRLHPSNPFQFLIHQSYYHLCYTTWGKRNFVLHQSPSIVRIF
jgi:hypothetical protein